MSYTVDTSPVQKCRGCQQEIEDDLPNLEDRLEEMTIREDPNRGVSIVSDLARAMVRVSDDSIARISVVDNGFFSREQQNCISSWHVSGQLRQASCRTR